MKKATWIIAFLAILLAHLYAVYSGNKTMQLICKPLLMPVLIVYFLLETRSFVTRLKLWIILALFFSWVGDVLLMFEDRDPIFFLLGLSAFLIAQVFYIIFFHYLRMREYIRGNALLLLLVVLYYAIIINILGPALDTPAFKDMRLPVRVYGVVISFMLMLALHLIFSKNKKAAWYMIIGAVLFITSDTLLAFDKFHSSIAYGGIFIMLTYGLAQLLITAGVVKYIITEAKS